MRSRARWGKTTEDKELLGTRQKTENRDSTVEAAFPDLPVPGLVPGSLSKVSRDSDAFYAFYDFYVFNDLTLTAYRSPLTTYSMLHALCSMLFCFGLFFAPVCRCLTVSSNALDRYVVGSDKEGHSKTMKATIVHGNLLDQDVEVIVNAWNRNIIPWWLLLPQGVSGAIKKRGGFEPFREVSRHGPIPLGQAVLTGAGRLPFKAIIHVAGINMLWQASERSIRGSVKSAMRIVDEQGFSSVAFPVIGAGSGSFDADKAFQLMLDEFLHIESESDVTIVRYTKK